MDFTAAELASFRDNFLGHAYPCRFASCVHVTKGFETHEQRIAHEETHELSFPCTEQGCQYPPFGSKRALARHHAQCHKQQPGKLRIRSLRASAYKGKQSVFPTTPMQDVPLQNVPSSRPVDWEGKIRSLFGPDAPSDGRIHEEAQITRPAMWALHTSELYEANKARELEEAKQHHTRLQRQLSGQHQQHQAHFPATQTSQAGKVVQEAAIDAEFQTQQTEAQRQDGNAPVPGTDFQEQFDSTARTNSYLDDFDYETFLFPDTPVNDDTDPLHAFDKDAPSEWPYVNSQTPNESPYSNLRPPTPRGSSHQVGVRQRPPMYQPGQIRNLPHLTDNEKRQYKAALRNLWAEANNSPLNSPSNIAATQNIIRFSKLLIAQIQARRTSVQQQQQQLQARQQGTQGQQCTLHLSKMQERSVTLTACRPI